jgi:DNA-directed RNA polymerase subunit M/transcription elongation factor TFIIS
MGVFITCGKCGNEQQSQAVQMTSKATFEAMKDVGSLKESCKKCGVEIEVNKKTLYWRDDRAAP